MRDLYQKISNTLESILLERYPDVVASAPLWEVPTREEFGDFSTSITLKIASQLKKDPLAIAEEIKQVLEKRLPTIEKIEVIKPGFINLFFSRKALIEALRKLLIEGKNFFASNKKGKILIEFVSANPTGPLSIAHGRQAVVGDVISCIYEFFGNEVTREYYINDEGRQIELLIKSVQERVKEIRGQSFSIPEDGYHGEYIKQIATEIIKRRVKNLREYTLQLILSWIKKDLARLGVKFNSWVSQKELGERGKVNGAIKFLKGKGVIYERDGALWFRSSRYGDQKDRVLRKKDGEFTYFASDIGYHRDKLKRGFKRLINLWGPDHHGYIQRVKASIQALGFNPEILNIIIIQLVSIKSKQRMSKRKGTAIYLSDLLDNVGKDVARFYYLTRTCSSPLEFDIDKALSASFDNPLYYIQYAYARICSIFRRAKIKELNPNYTAFLQDEKEFLLLRKILQFSYCLDKVYYSLEPVYLVEYLKDIATTFHKFYETRRVLGEDENITLARLNLLEATRLVLNCGLNLLGIKPLKRM
jgi:arginyl-tRNA synthetase